MVASPATVSSESVMLDPKALEEFATRLSAVMHSPAADIEKNARALLASFFTKLDLVTERSSRCKPRSCAAPVRS